MSMTDTVSDMLTRIRNATTVRHDRTDVPASKMKLEVAKIEEMGKHKGEHRDYLFALLDALDGGRPYREAFECLLAQVARQRPPLQNAGEQQGQAAGADNASPPDPEG